MVHFQIVFLFSVRLLSVLIVLTGISSHIKLPLISIDIFQSLVKKIVNHSFFNCIYSGCSSKAYFHYSFRHPYTSAILRKCLHFCFKIA